MICRETINVRAIKDYDRISKLVDSDYIDEDLIEQLKRYIGLSCRKILIEYPYYERDYLSSYYIFYVKKLQKFPKECYRVLFYEDAKAETLMGYITLRPTYDGRRLGKIFFNPCYLLKEKAHLILGDSKCHIGGSESVLRLFPHMKQEGDVAVCAHVATWSVLRSFASRFHRYPEFTLGKIVEMVSPESERMIPSRGLTAHQISQIFLDAGFSPVILHRDEKNPRLIKEALISYIASGIPIVAVLTNRNHAVSVVGLGHDLSNTSDLTALIEATNPFESYWENENEIMTKVVLTARFYNSIAVNDDNFFPYTMVRMKSAETEEAGNDLPPYIIPEIDRLIIPLYPRIQLTYEDVRTIFLRLVTADQNKWGGPIIGRIFLASANTYREYINRKCTRLNPNVRQILINLEMSRFIWCVEVSTPEQYTDECPISGLIIFDSTSATINPEPFLFLAAPDGSVFYTTESRIIVFQDRTYNGLCMPRFNENLEEVN